MVASEDEGDIELSIGRLVKQVQQELRSIALNRDSYQHQCRINVDIAEEYATVVHCLHSSAHYYQA